MSEVPIRLFWIATSVILNIFSLLARCTANFLFCLGKSHCWYRFSTNNLNNQLSENRKFVLFVEKEELWAIIFSFVVVDHIHPLASIRKAYVFLLACQTKSYVINVNFLKKIASLFWKYTKRIRQLIFIRLRKMFQQNGKFSSTLAKPIVCKKNMIIITRKFLIRVYIVKFNNCSKQRLRLNSWNQL